jgi:hypothetical protein
MGSLRITSNSFKGGTMFGKKRNEIYPSTKGSEVYVHSGLAESWGALDSDGIGDPDDVREDVEIMEQLDMIDDSTPEGAAEKERLEKKFVANMLAHIAVSECDTQVMSTEELYDSRSDNAA